MAGKDWTEYGWGEGLTPELEKDALTVKHQAMLDRVEHADENRHSPVFEDGEAEEFAVVVERVES